MCLPYDVLLFEDGTVLANTLIAVFGFAGAAHAGAETAAHTFLKAKLARRFTCVIYRLKHRFGAAGIEIGLIKAVHSVGNEAFYAVTAVGGGYKNFCAKSGKLVLVKDVAFAIKAQNYGRLFALRY